MSGKSFYEEPSKSSATALKRQSAQGVRSLDQGGYHQAGYHRVVSDGMDIPIQHVTPDLNAAPMHPVPLERQACMLLTEAVLLFNQSYPNCMAEWREFADAIHRCQESMGSLRFWHAMNQDYRKQWASQLTNPPDEVMTTDARVEQLRHGLWRYRQHVMQQTVPAAREILLRLCSAFECVIELTDRHRDQHVYDDFAVGMERALVLLSRLNG